MSYRSMSQMPAHGNAGAKVANAREGFQMGGKYGSMKGDYAPGMAGGHYMEGSCAMPMPTKPCEAPCHFPAPAPKRCYCQPAAFTSLDGRSHFSLLSAYGTSRACSAYY
ncbi:MAG: hypothetical protein ACOC4M_12755 [Promethearchaeia archaeon]